MSSNISFKLPLTLPLLTPTPKPESSPSPRIPLPAGYSRSLTLDTPPCSFAPNGFLYLTFHHVKLLPSHCSSRFMMKISCLISFIAWSIYLWKSKT